MGNFRLQRIDWTLAGIVLGLVSPIAMIFVGTSFSGCTTDCIYESYTNDEGQTACARVCPLTDAEGNDIQDSDGKLVYESPLKGEDVDRINCDPFRSVTNSTLTTTTSSSSSSGTS